MRIFLGLLGIILFYYIGNPEARESILEMGKRIFSLCWPSNQYENQQFLKKISFYYFLFPLEIISLIFIVIGYSEIVKNYSQSYFALFFSMIIAFMFFGWAVLHLEVVKESSKDFMRPYNADRIHSSDVE